MLHNNRDSPDYTAQSVAQSVVDILLGRRVQLVLAESCSAGLIAATLGRIPGVSRVLAGSAVVYQVDTKVAWLQIDPQLLLNKGPVSPEIALAMARQVLAITPHADVAVSITGHLGPNAPEPLDGVAFTAIATRNSTNICTQLKLLPAQVPDPVKNSSSDHQPQSCNSAVIEAAAILRQLRQLDAVRQTLLYLHAWLLDDEQHDVI